MRIRQRGRMRQVCPAHNDGEVMSSACIESVMAQAAAALKEYACNGGAYDA